MYTAGSKIKANQLLAHHSVRAMNSELNLVVCNTTEESSAAFFQAANHLVRKYEYILSRYDEQAELYRLNHEAHDHPVLVCETLWNSIQLGMHYFEKTRGYFNIFMGKYFHELKAGKPIMDIPQIAPKDAIVMDESARTIHFSDPRVSIDFGGMGKGIVLAELKKILKDSAIPDAFISFGGSSILTQGSHPHGDHWPLSLREYGEFSLELNNDTVSISSNYLTSGEKETVHVLNPYISTVKSKKTTAIVQTGNPVDAEVFSTALIAAPESIHPQLAASFHHAKYNLIEATYEPTK